MASVISDTHDDLLTPDHRTAIDRFREEHATHLLVILFTDLVGSTDLKSQLGDQPAKRLMDEHRRLMLLALEEIQDAQAIKTDGAHS